MSSMVGQVCTSRMVVPQGRHEGKEGTVEDWQIPIGLSNYAYVASAEELFSGSLVLRYL